MSKDTNPLSQPETAVRPPDSPASTTGEAGTTPTARDFGVDLATTEAADHGEPVPPMGHAADPSPDPAVPTPPDTAATAGPPPSQPAALGSAMKPRNIFAVWIGLPLITLGIYHLVWYYKIHKEMAAFDPRRNGPVAGPVLVLIFLGWTIIAPLISYHNTGVRVRNAQASAGLPQTCSPAASWLLGLVFGLNSLYLQTELNKVVGQYPGASPGTQVPLAA